MAYMETEKKVVDTSKDIKAPAAGNPECKDAKSTVQATPIPNANTGMKHEEEGKDKVTAFKKETPFEAKSAFPEKKAV